MFNDSTSFNLIIFAFNDSLIAKEANDYKVIFKLISRKQSDNAIAKKEKKRKTPKKLTLVQKTQHRKLINTNPIKVVIDVLIVIITTKMTQETHTLMIMMI